MIQDLVAGQIDLTFTQVGRVRWRKSAPVRLKAYGVMAKKGAWPATPDTPSVQQAGVPGLRASFWHGLWAPKGTPKDGDRQPSCRRRGGPWPIRRVRHRLADLGRGISPREQQTPEALAAQQKAEIEKWWPIIKAANIKAE